MMDLRYKNVCFGREYFLYGGCTGITDLTVLYVVVL